MTTIYGVRTTYGKDVENKVEAAYAAACFTLALAGESGELYHEDGAIGIRNLSSYEREQQMVRIIRNMLGEN